jgi:hypothetical protein
MRFMWTPPTMWNHQSDGIEHWKLEHVNNYESKPKNLKMLKLELRKVLIQAPKSKISILPNLVS